MVDSVEGMMMHGLANPKHTDNNLKLLLCNIYIYIYSPNPFSSESEEVKIERDASNLVLLMRLTYWAKTHMR